MGQRKGTAHHITTWPEKTTQADIAAYASEEFSHALLQFLAAETIQDIESMNVQSKTMRTVATRIDQFRRMRVRQWRVQRASVPKSTSTEVRSVK